MAAAAVLARRNCISVLPMLAIIIWAQLAFCLSVQLQPQQQSDAAAQLAKRLLNVDAARFSFKVLPDSLLPRHRALIINTGPNSVQIQANSGVAAAWGLHHYLTEYCSAVVTWTGARIALPPDHLPEVPGGKLNLTSQDAFTVMPNVVTFSYSYTWWSFTDWQRHIDWMALHGVNLAYALTGQERVFRTVFRRFGLSDHQLDAHFPGPAFLAWGRLGNLKAWGGPLPADWYDKQAALQKQILQRMASLGMTPILQGFSGMVPDGFVEIYPNVNYSRLSDWNNFGRNYSEIVLIDPRDPMFINVSTAIVMETVKTFGSVTHFYAMDPFNENTPISGDPDYIRAVSAAIFKGLRQADANGIWVLQSWFLNNAAGFWTPTRARAFFEPIEKPHEQSPQPRENQLLVIDLWGDTADLPQRLAGFYGHKFVWTVVHNFGGNNAMFGSLAQLSRRHGPFRLRREFPDGMAGVGIVPEAIGQNEVVYELAMEFNWRSRGVQQLQRWIRDYARRRYGRQDPNLMSAWEQLLSSLYNEPEHRFSGPVLVLRPSLTLNESFYYNASLVEAAWRQLIATNETGNLLLNYDQVDLTRQMLQIRFYQYYIVLINAARNMNASAVERTGAILLNLLDSMNQLLQTDEHFLLQNTIEDAKSFAAGRPDVARLYEFNVRNQLTCWGPGPHTIQDYAARMYNGLISAYYRPRWALFVQRLSTAVSQHVPFDEDQFVRDVFLKVELPFYTGNSSTGPSKPTGSPYDAVKQVEKSLPPEPAGTRLQGAMDEETNSTWPKLAALAT